MEAKSHFPDNETAPTVQDAVLAGLTERCLRAALIAVSEAISAGIKPDRRSSFVEVMTNEEGKRTKSANSPPLNYGSLIKAKDRAWPKGVCREDIDGYQDLSNYLRSVPAYWSYLSAESHFENSDYSDWPGSDSPGFSERWFTISVETFLSSLLDRHVHAGGWDFDAAVFRDNYLLRERELRAIFPGTPALTVDVLVPLFGLTFHSDSGHLLGGQGGRRIEALSEAQLSACWPSHRISDAEADLLLSASHAWVSPSVEVRKQPFAGWLIPSGLSFDELDRVLEVAAISANGPFGTKHVLYRPNGWADHWNGNLPAGGSWTWTVDRMAKGLDEGTVPAEPTILEDEKFVTRFAALSSGPHELHLAARRLLGACLRKDPIDAVIDACIGIEALVGDSSSNDITYKLAIRSAAVLAQAGVDDTVGIFNTVRNLYSRRSKIVHGKLGPQDVNAVKALGGQFSANSVGTVLLSALLSAVLDNPQLISRISNDDLVLSLLKRLDSAEGA